MKRILAVIAVTFAWANALPMSAQEPVEAEIELVRQLRNKGWHDLAKIKLEELLKRDPSLKAVMSLELARINIAMGRQDPKQQLTLFAEARTLLQDFVAKNKDKADGALASAEMARLSSASARAQLTRAMRADEATRQEIARTAEKMFILAGKDLEAAVTLIDAALNDPANANLKAVLQKEVAQARFDGAINIFDQARTHFDKFHPERVAAIEKAQKAFIALRGDDEYYWLANAWLMKIAMEQTAPDEVVKYHTFIMKNKDDKAALPAILPAVRLVKFFQMQDLTLRRDDEPETLGQNAIHTKKFPKDKQTDLQRLRAVQTAGETWLKDYGGFVRTYEGQGVLYELGHAYYQDALTDPKLANQNFEKALKYFDELVKLDGDLVERAKQFSMSIKFKRLDVKADLKTFEEFRMKAMVEKGHVIALSQKLADPKPAERKTIEEKRRKHLKEVINALTRALTLTTPQTPLKEVDDARYDLTGAYLAYGDPYRAAIVAESLARAKPATAHSAEAAATAIQTYSALQNRHPDDAAIKQRLHDLAEFVLSPEKQRAWEAEPVTGRANYHLAMSARRANDPKKALAYLEKLRPEFPDYIYTQGQALFIAEAAREKAEDKTEKKFYLDAARAALARMPKLNPKTEAPSVIAMYFYAKLENAKYQYMEAIEDLNAKADLKTINKCNAMSKFVQELVGEFEQVRMHAGGDDYIPNGQLSKQNHEQIQFSMATWLKYADLGIAETRFRGDAKDRFDLVLKATDKVVNDTLALAQKTKAPDPIAMKDYRVTGDILGLALRANVQKGEVEKGRAILDVLKRITSPAGEKGPNVVAVLLNDIAGQIKRMNTDKDPALQATKKHYVKFLDEITKEYDAKGYDNAAAIMMAHAFNSLEYPCKAAVVFSKVKPGVDLDKKIEKKKIETEAELKARQAWEEENNRYWGVQVEYIRALRACKEKDSLTAAEKVADTVLKHPSAAFKIQAMIEKNLLLEDQQKFREAYLQWQQFMKLPPLQNLGNADVQKVYFTGYFYNARTLYKVATLDPLIKDRPKLVNAAATMIVNLEFAKTKQGWEIAGPLFRDLLKEEKQLADAYEKAKAARLKTGSRFDMPRNVWTGQRALSMPMNHVQPGMSKPQENHESTKLRKHEKETWVRYSVSIVERW